MGQQRIRMGLFGAAIALSAVLILLLARPRVGPLGRAFTALQGRSAAPSAGAGAAVPALSAAAAEGPSRLADDLNSPAGDIHADLRLVDAIFAAYRGALRTGNPVGENSEITAALTGRNKLGYAFIPPGIPAINAKGELCDRWGTPFFFHQLSGERMEIRSAGPDHRLWTADDEVLTP
jgi:hypothetical protein